MLACLLIVGAVTVVQCEPYIPQAGSNVLENIRTTAFDPAAHEIRNSAPV